MVAIEQVGGSRGDGPRVAQASDEEVAAPPLDPKAVAKKIAMMTGSSCPDGDGSGAAQMGAKQAPKAMPDPKMAAKRAAMVMGSSGSNPPRKQFYATWGPDKSRSGAPAPSPGRSHELWGHQYGT
jgi:hypothetical protein